MALASVRARRGFGWVFAVGVVLATMVAVAADAAPLAEYAKLTASDAATADLFGYSVAVSGDTVVVAADDSDGSGLVYVFTPDGSGGYEEVKLTASDGDSSDGFGASIAVSGTTVVVGAPDDNEVDNGAGAAYVFTADGLGGYDEVKLTASDAATGDHFGRSVAVADHTVVVGGPNNDDAGEGSGAAYVFTPDGSGGYDEVKLTASDAITDEFFGDSVAVSGDTVVVGAPGDPDGSQRPGSAYVFNPDGAGGYNEWLLLPNDPDQSDDFGASVSVSGTTVVVGAPGRHEHANYLGAVYVFTPAQFFGYQQVELTPSDDGLSEFGSSVAVSDGTVVVGAPRDDDNGAESGAAYVFTPFFLGGYVEAKLTPSDVDAADRTGWSVAISGGTVVVGAPFDEHHGLNSPGSAYVFVPATLPGAPAVIRNATAGNASATVSWTAPGTDGGSPITGYVVTPYVGYYALPSTTFSSTATSQTVTGLTNGTQYRFRVQAVNAVGTSGYSKVTNPVSPTV
jgi:hypothetical protein